MTTYSTSLKLELPGDGQQTGTWGQTTNKNIGTLLEQAITGVQAIVMFDANYTLTNLNGTTDEARNAVLVVTGTNTAQRDVIAPIQEKLYTVYNNTTGGFSIRIIGASGTGVVIPNGMITQVFFDGTNYVPLQNGVPTNFVAYGNLGVTGTTVLDAGLTGTTATFSGAISSVSPTFTGTVTVPTPTVGDNTTKAATTAFVNTAIAAAYPVGSIYMNASNGTNPATLLGFGTWTALAAGRMLLGNGGGFSAGSTGGSAVPALLSHTHTATSNVSDPQHQHLALDPNAGTYQNFAVVNGGGAVAAVYNNVPNGSFNTGFASTGISVSTSVSAASSGDQTTGNLPPYLVVYMWQRTA